jgi:hypothetical protein
MRWGLHQNGEHDAWISTEGFTSGGDDQKEVCECGAAVGARSGGPPASGRGQATAA